MNRNFLTPPTAAPDMAARTIYTLVPPKVAVTTASPSAAKGDDDVMSTPVVTVPGKSVHPKGLTAL